MIINRNAENLEQELKNLGVVDYIVEQGTSGIWTYRKWASGIAECWGKYTATLTHYSTWNSFYNYGSVVDLPFTFAGIPIKNYNVQVGSGAALPSTAVMNDTASQIGWHCLSTSGNSQFCTVIFDVKGRWK